MLDSGLDILYKLAIVSALGSVRPVTFATGLVGTSAELVQFGPAPDHESIFVNQGEDC
jgi:hypothetical protein